MRKNGGARRKALEGMGLNVFLTGVGSSLESLALVSSATLALIGLSGASHVGYWTSQQPSPKRDLYPL